MTRELFHHHNSLIQVMSLKILLTFIYFEKKCIKCYLYLHLYTWTYTDFFLRAGNGGGYEKYLPSATKFSKVLVNFIQSHVSYAQWDCG